MKKQIVFHSKAIEELAKAEDYYFDLDAALESDFKKEFSTALLRASVLPESFSKYLIGTRRCILRRFPYHIVFVELDDVIRVIAVAHERRKPGYWKSRLSN